MSSILLHLSPVYSRFSFPFSTSSPGDHRDLPSFPTRRSSDLRWLGRHDQLSTIHLPGIQAAVNGGKDRKSTRLNSSHLGISYAVFCLKKKNQHGKTNVRRASRLQCGSRCRHSVLVVEQNTVTL